MSIGKIAWRKCTIANGAALSDALDMSGQRLVCIRSAASLEGTSLSAEVSYDGGTTYEQLYVHRIEATGAAGVTAEWEVAITDPGVLFLPDEMRVYGPSHMKLRSEDGSAADVNQTGDHDVWVALEELAERYN